MKEVIGMPNVVSDCVPIKTTDKFLTNDASLLTALKTNAQSYEHDDQG